MELWHLVGPFCIMYNYGDLLVAAHWLPVEAFGLGWKWCPGRPWINSSGSAFFGRWA